MAERRTPRFNHVAMSVAAETLTEKNRLDIADFYSEVFGWNEIEQMTIDQKRMILNAYRMDQFVFIIADEPHMTAPRMDHFGMSVDSLDYLEEIYGKAKAYAAKDERVDLVEMIVDDQEVVKIHSFYVRFLLPMMVEVQWFEFPSNDSADLLATDAVTAAIGAA